MQKLKQFRSKAYLSYIRTKPCCHCMNPNTVAHHVIGMGNGAMGSRASDFDTMSLCVSCHALIHENYKAFDQLLYLHRMQTRALSEGVIRIEWTG